jgi:aryl-alcohol dehydrogenase-like predicted oxidoreductase
LVSDATNPANATKFAAADGLGALADEAGMTLIQMAIAFVTRHPAVTSASSARAPSSTWTATSP